MGFEVENAGLLTCIIMLLLFSLLAGYFVFLGDFVF